MPSSDEHVIQPGNDVAKGYVRLQPWLALKPTETQQYSLPTNMVTKEGSLRVVLDDGKGRGG